MSTINPNRQDLSTPFSDKAGAKLLAHIEQREHIQTTAADATGTVIWIASFSGVLYDAYVVLANLPGAGESMVFDLLKNGATVLSSAFTADATTVTAKGTFALSIDPAKDSFVKGDVFVASRDYTAGGTPTPILNTAFVIEPSVERPLRA